MDKIDYSKAENWAYWNKGGDKAADVFAVYPTFEMGLDGRKNADIADEEYRTNVLNGVGGQIGAFEGIANVYVPFYRQVAFDEYLHGGENRENAFKAAYEDVKTAFLKFEKASDKPIIISSYSQGAEIALHLLAELFSEERLMKRLVAAYCIGCKFTKEMTDKYPHLKPARGEDDLGVIISYNTEAKYVTESVFVGANEKTFSINPINWKTDSTPAAKWNNKGSRVVDINDGKIYETLALTGAYIDEKRGTLKVTDINEKNYPNPLFERGVYHMYDYQFFYKNIQENAKRRLEKYLSENLK